MAFVTALFSLALVYKASELPVGYVPGEGPTAGAFPFWLGVGMFLCCLWTMLRWFRRTSAPSRSSEPFMDRQAVNMFVVTAGSLGTMIALVHVIGVYGAVPLFLAFYMRFVGRHSWAVVLPIALLSPVAMFMFFEIALTITLPKGVKAIDELYYPIFDLVYG